MQNSSDLGSKNDDFSSSNGSDVADESSSNVIKTNKKNHESVMSIAKGNRNELTNITAMLQERREMLEQDKGHQTYYYSLQVPINEQFSFR